MVNKLLALLLMAALAFPLSTTMIAQDATMKAAKEARWEGHIIRSNKDQSRLTIRKAGSSDERIVQYDSSTRWVSQEHASKTVNDINATQVNDGDRVICTGTWDKNGVLHATLVSKRLTGM